MTLLTKASASRSIHNSALLVTQSIHDSCDNTSPLVRAFPIVMLFQWQWNASTLLCGLNKFHDSRANETQKIVALFCSVSIQKYYYISPSWSSSCQDKVFITPQSALLARKPSFELVITGSETGTLPFPCLPHLHLHFFSSHSCLILAPSLSFFFLIHAPLQALVSRYSWLGWSADASLESFGI